MKKITKATIKSFINKNIDNLFIKVEDSFDGMVDCVMPVEDEFHPIIKTESNDNNMGIKGCWFVNESRDCFKTYEDDIYIGYSISNCCGSFKLVIKK